MYKSSKEIIIVIIIIIISGCASEFEQQSLSYAKDKQIDQQELEELVNIISLSDEGEFKKFKTEGNQIDTLKVVSYLDKYFSAKKLNLTEADIWRPIPAVSKNESFNINVYIENSGSMNGYLSDPHTQFKNSVYSLLTRLKLFENKDSLNLFFINKDDQLIFGNASDNDVEDFNDILDPTSFATYSAGKTGSTDINELIKKCIDKADDRNLSVFISDCIYSPEKNVNAKDYLTEQKNGIFLHVGSALQGRKSNLSVLILHLTGGFRGTYNDCQDGKPKFDTPIQRPFYIWFIGTKQQVEKVVYSKKLEELDGGYINKMIFQPAVNEKLSGEIMGKALFGEFDKKNIKENVIKKPTLSNGKFGFTILVNFSKGIQDASYYLDTLNYKVSNTKYKLNVRLVPDENNVIYRGYTHLLELETTEISTGPLQISLIGRAPNWIYTYNSTDDSDIKNDTSEHKKTFGLAALVQGVSEAFYPKSELNIISSISITINK